MFHTEGQLFKNTFETPEMRNIFGQKQFIEQFLEVEAALARAEAEADLIPDKAAEIITEKASLDHLDLNKVHANTEETNIFTMAIIDAWKDEMGEAGEYIHWGATSQDISDTAVLLQIRDGLDVVERDLSTIQRELTKLTSEHSDTPMIGRTHYVHALPITFGLKTATWLNEIDRHLHRLNDLRERLLSLQFFGAVGSLASLGESGLAVQEKLATELNLEIADVAWFTSRDRFAELLMTLAMVATSLGKIASQVLLYNRPEVNELSEPIPGGKIGSSTMPHKRNPVKSEESKMLSRLVRSHASTMLEIMGGYDERDASTWFAEFAIIPETFRYTSRILRNMHEILANLDVNAEKMSENLKIHGDLVTSEAVMMALANEVGRQTAHKILFERTSEAIESNHTFAACLKEDKRVTEVLSEDQIDRLTNPTNYTGLSAQLARRTL